MHLINRAASFSFPEQSSAFRHIVASFGKGAWNEKPQLTA
jgi:hypothetical protein